MPRHFLGGGSLSKIQESQKHKASFAGANCIVQKIHSLLQHLYFILYCQNGDTCWVSAFIIGEEQMGETQLEVILSLK